MTGNDWDKRCKHVEKIKKQYLNTEAGADEVVDCFIINTGGKNSADYYFAEGDNLSGFEELLGNN